MRTKTVVSAAFAATLAAQGCTSAPSEPKVEIDSATQELIGGVQANSAALDAIGALGALYVAKNCETGLDETTFVPYCSASLISARSIVTAKHCVDALRELQQYDGVTSAFGIGSDGFHPKRIVKAIDSARAPGDEGGLVGLGRDVGVVHLAETVDDVAPLSFAKLPASAIGKRYGAIGYGVQDNRETYGTRRAGSLTINATSGKFYELVFGSFDAFKQWALTGVAPDAALALLAAGQGQTVQADGSDAEDGSFDGSSDGSDDDWYDAYLREIYDTTYLLDGYEAYVGNREGDAQTCYGDSGSPLVKAKNDGTLVAYGVVSAGIGSNRLICDYGGAYAIFGDDVNTWLKKQKAWKDPCKGISEDGVCDGNRAKRCTNPAEGPRRLTVTDCGLFAQTCAVASNGEAVCAAPGEEPVVLPEPEQPDYCNVEDAGMGMVDGGVDPEVPDGEAAFLAKVEARLAKVTKGPLSKLSGGAAEK